MFDCSISNNWGQSSSHLQLYIGRLSQVSFYDRSTKKANMWLSLCEYSDSLLTLKSSYAKWYYRIQVHVAKSLTFVEGLRIAQYEPQHHKSFFTVFWYVNYASNFCHLEFLISRHIYFVELRELPSPISLISRVVLDIFKTLKHQLSQL